MIDAAIKEIERNPMSIGDCLRLSHKVGPLGFSQIRSFKKNCNDNRINGNNHRDFSAKKL